jgi:L-ribulose-5-phosphate 3-epimerase
VRFAYDTNGFADHRVTDVLAVLADLGYDGVALTLDSHRLASYADDPAAHVAAIVARLDELGLAVVIGTDTDHSLDPRREHVPTLVGADGAGPRVDLLCRAVRFAAEIGSPVVSFRSGASEERAGPDVSWDRLLAGCAVVLDEAAVHGITLGFEPRSGAFVETVEGYLELHRRLGAPEHLGLTLGVGTGFESGAESESESESESGSGSVGTEVISDRVRRLAPYLVDVRIADGIEHAPLLGALYDIGYAGLIGVGPLSGPATAETARHSLRSLRHTAGRTPVGN